MSPFKCQGLNAHDVCGMIPLTIEGASGALYTQNSGVIFIRNTPGTVLFKRRLRSRFVSESTR
jgi:hypothetical protein